MNSTTTATAAAGDAPQPRRSDAPTIIVQRSGLPAPLANLVLSVTGKCRLWKSERSEVARELCAHFLDGLDSGASPAQLAESFGDPRRTARLITITRKKLSPLWWRTWRMALRGVAALLLICFISYGILAARFFLYSPKISRNFMQEFNAPILRTPIDDRAWPDYIKARTQFGPLPEFMTRADANDPRRPGDPGWPEMVQWLDSHRSALATVRAAAAKPTLGYIYRSTTDPEYARALELTSPGYKHDPASEEVVENPLVVGILLPHLGEMRRFARWLQADAHLAASRGDSAAYLADVNALLGIAEQTFDDRFVISQLVGLAVADLAFSTITREAATEKLLSREQLRDLAHTVSAFASGRIEIDVSREIATVDDILQRFYSDNGRGDGHFIGSPQMDRIYVEWGIPKPRGLPLLKAFQPLQSAVMPSRAEVNRLAREFVAAAAVDTALPPWRHLERTSDKHYEALMNSGLYTVLPFLSSLQGGADQSPIQNAMATRDLVETKRQTALTVLALESFRRVRGQWPATLDDLVPAYLPAVPIDPFTGRPLRYQAPKSESELPLVYSTGVDTIDDGGQAPATKAGRAAVRDFQWFGPNSQPTPDPTLFRGDWILWPEPLEPPAPGDPAAPSAP